MFPAVTALTSGDASAVLGSAGQVQRSADRAEGTSPQPQATSSEGMRRRQRCSGWAAPLVSPSPPAVGGAAATAQGGPQRTSPAAAKAGAALWHHQREGGETREPSAQPGSSRGFSCACRAGAELPSGMHEGTRQGRIVPRTTFPSAPSPFPRFYANTPSFSIYQQNHHRSPLST